MGDAKFFGWLGCSSASRRRKVWDLEYSVCECGQLPRASEQRGSGAYFASGWFGGPGAGATAHFQVLQDTSSGFLSQYLSIDWSFSAKNGEAQYQPTFRYTFLENHLYTGNTTHDVTEFYGRTVVLTFWARVGSGAVQVVPVAWQSWDSQTFGVAGVKGKGYQVFEASGQSGVVAVAQGTPNPNAPVTVTTQWQQFTTQIAIPDSAGKSLSVGAYTGFGFDFDTSEGPVLDIGNVEVQLLNRP